MLLCSWILFKFFASETERTLSLGATKWALVTGLFLTLAATWSIRNFSQSTFDVGTKPVLGEEVVNGIWKFDFPFLADKVVWERTVNAFVEDHPELEVTYIYTGPSELNSKKKTHLLLYVFTQAKSTY